MATPSPRTPVKYSKEGALYVEYNPQTEPDPVRYEREVRDDSGKLLGLLTAMHDGMIFFSQDTRLLFESPSALRLFAVPDPIPGNYEEIYESQLRSPLREYLLPKPTDQAAE